MKFPAEQTVMCLLGPCINEINEIKTVIWQPDSPWVLDNNGLTSHSFHHSDHEMSLPLKDIHEPRPNSLRYWNLHLQWNTLPFRVTSSTSFRPRLTRILFDISRRLGSPPLRLTNQEPPKFQSVPSFSFYRGFSLCQWPFLYWPAILATSEVI